MRWEKRPRESPFGFLSDSCCAICFLFNSDSYSVSKQDLWNKPYRFVLKNTNQILRISYALLLVRFVLHSTPLLFCAQFKVLVFSSEALYGLGPGGLKDCLFQYNRVCALCSSMEALLCVLPAREDWLVGMRRSAFLGVAPVLWSSLPENAHLAPSSTAFR